MNGENENSFNGFAGFEEAPATKDETDDVVASEAAGHHGSENGYETSNKPSS
jgi:hypothetical protein